MLAVEFLEEREQEMQCRTVIVYISSIHSEKYSPRKATVAATDKAMWLGLQPLYIRKRTVTRGIWFFRGATFNLCLSPEPGQQSVVDPTLAVFSCPT